VRNLFPIDFDFLQVICAIVLLLKEGTLRKQFRQWTLLGSLTASGLPAAIYAVQNSLLQISYKNLDSLTFSILNQTKLFFTAFFTFLILGYTKFIPSYHLTHLLIIQSIGAPFRIL
jgi:solute carrier family 35 (UDP-sugar transporter), member A1/2/3